MQDGAGSVPPERHSAALEYESGCLAAAPIQVVEGQAQLQVVYLDVRYQRRGPGLRQTLQASKA